MLVFIRGAGDLATGIAVRLHNAGFAIVMTDLEQPLAIRRTVSFCSAIQEKRYTIENVHAVSVSSIQEVRHAIQQNEIPIFANGEELIKKELSPDIIIEATLAKRNLNLTAKDARIVIAVGPGFTAPQDCHAVIETKRGHYLGKIYYNGSAIPDTKIPGNIGGYTKERLLLAPADGTLNTKVEIGSSVHAGDIVATVNNEPMIAQISGMVRGLLPNGTIVTKGMKSGDIDPRNEKDYCYSISDKARAISGSVLEAILSLLDYHF